jgi:hypothetical protein
MGDVDEVGEDGAMLDLWHDADFAGWLLALAVKEAPLGDAVKAFPNSSRCSSVSTIQVEIRFCWER